MAQKAQNVSSTVSASIISLIVGGVIGFYVQSFAANKAASATAAPSQTRGAGGGGMRGGGGGGFGGAPSPGADLARLVRNLDTVEKVQGAALNPTQNAALSPILTKIKSSDTISETDAKADADAIQQILTPAQKDALTAIQPQRGGRGGGGAGGPGGGGGFGGPGGPGGGGRGAQDPTKPFASGRSADALEDLIASTGKR